MSFTDAIRGHVLQWFHEKNRKIEDGYDYEVMAIILLHKKSFNNKILTCINSAMSVVVG